MANASALVLTGHVVGTLDDMSPLDQARIGFLTRMKNPKTRKTYADELDIFLSWCTAQELPPLQARRPHLELYLRWLESTLWAESTINRRFGIVCGFYKYATIDNLILKDPSLDIDRPTVDHDKQHCPFLNPLEFAAFMQAAANEEPHEHALIELLCGTGMRIGAATSLQISNLQELKGHRVIVYVGKGGKVHTDALPPAAFKTIDAAVAGREVGQLLLNRWGNPMTRENARDTITRIAHRAGITVPITPHGLRRSWITIGLVMGKSLYDMQLAAGHANPATTARYDRLANNVHRVASTTYDISGFINTLTG